MSPVKPANQSWNVYMVRCADGSLYTGIALSVKKRVTEHNESNAGAKYTRGRRPVKLVYFETHNSRSAASKRESVIKAMDKTEKEALVNAKNR